MKIFGLNMTLDKTYMIIKSKWLKYKKISPNTFWRKLKKFKSTHEREQKNT